MSQRRIHFTTRDLLARVCIRARPDCPVSFRNQGGFGTVAPGLPGNVQVKGVVKIHVK